MIMNEQNGIAATVEQRVMGILYFDGFEGVEKAKAEWEANKLTVRGEVDPSELRDELQERLNKKVELVSPQPPKKDKDGDNNKGDNKKSDSKNNKKNDDKGSKDSKKSDDEKPKEKKEVSELMQNTSLSPFSGGSIFTSGCLLRMICDLFRLNQCSILVFQTKVGIFINECDAN